MLPEDAADHHSELGPGRFLYGPVNRHVPAYRLDEFAGADAEGLVSEHPDGTVVYLESVIERQFLVGQPKVLPPAMRRAHLLGQLDQVGNDLGRLDRAVLVPPDRLLEHRGEVLALDQVPSRSDLDLVAQELL